MADQYETEFNVTDGPSKFDLMAALFASTGRNTITVKFTIQQRIPGTAKASGAPQAIEVNIGSVEREDGSGQSWIVGGMANEGRRFACYFDSRTRSGWLAYLKK